MGIDTKDKRKSVVNWFLRLLPSPDTIIDIADRAQIGGLYRGVFSALNTRLASSDLLIFLRVLKSTTADIILLALNTDDLRKSVTNSISRILPFPDGVIDAADRRHVAGFYRRIFDVLYTIRSATANVIISSGFDTEYINLKSYINVSEDDESVITTSINDDSDIMISLSKFSETDSDISIIRYSSIDFTN